MRYKPFGEVRYAWKNDTLNASPAYALTRYTFTGQYSYMDDPSTPASEGFGLMHYGARMYDPALGRFTSADTIVPGGVQGYDRYAYVNNSPLNYVDPSGHEPKYGCYASTNGTCTNANGTPLSTGNGKGGRKEKEEEEKEKEGCGFFSCYETGWENFEQAWDIWTNSNATYGQRYAAGAYMGAWSGAHACLVICTGVAAVEYLVPGAISCALMLHCADAVFYSGGELAKKYATDFANTTGRYTINMTLPGRILDGMSEKIPYRYMDPLWRFASARFAQGASGVVNSFINPAVYNPLRTYGSTELSRLITNPNVIQIIPNILVP